MKFAKVISACGLNPNDYPNYSGTEITVCDRNDREIIEDDFNFDSPIFSENLSSLERFKDFLIKNEYEIFKIVLLEKFLVVVTSIAPYYFLR